MLYNIFKVSIVLTLIKILRPLGWWPFILRIVSVSQLPDQDVTFKYFPPLLWKCYREVLIMLSYGESYILLYEIFC